MGDLNISGGNQGPINTGSGTQDNRNMTIGVAGSPAAEDALTRLERLLDEHAPRLEEGDEARADLDDVRDQARKEKPDERRLADTLKRLSERVAAVGALAVAVKEVAAKLGVRLP
ncbi:DUF5955 family protein [Actinoallomurus soli]|uniref:DUF5955 family protein n=1 Tax=Actinoallomurus soli TaxID=2952535 RepID=UPI002092DF7A|nr:DUF5955 family protein [Actinoallomurus soli]MCO5968775.1 DUF5955 family protein [Actinoallomurus soli]